MSVHHHQLVPNMTKSTGGEAPTNTHGTYYSIKVSVVNINRSGHAEPPHSPSMEIVEIRPLERPQHGNCWHMSRTPHPLKMEIVVNQSFQNQHMLLKSKSPKWVLLWSPISHSWKHCWKSVLIKAPDTPKVEIVQKHSKGLLLNNFHFGGIWWL